MQLNEVKPSLASLSFADKALAAADAVGQINLADTARLAQLAQ